MSIKNFAFDLAQKLWVHCPRFVRHRLLRATQDNFLIGTIGIIENPNHEVLILEHRFRPPAPWGLPGGFLEKHETAHEGLIRELREETGLEITLNPRIYEVIFDTTVGHATIIMTGRTDRCDMKFSPEILSGGFYACEDVPNYTYKPHLELIQRWFKEAP